jgi:16S rRNA (adenine1518-N6/adenine1519-N6)-dimethyltransferase
MSSGDAMPEEIFDVVNERDEVIGQAPRSEVHARKLLHRAVHVFVVTSRGELLLQKRSEFKDEFPLKFTSSASGHLAAGETYDEAAPRELREELGIVGPLVRLQKFAAGPKTSYEHTVLYRVDSDSPPTIDPEEVAELLTWPMAEVQRRVEANPDEFCPAFRVLFEWFARSVKAN